MFGRFIQLQRAGLRPVVRFGNLALYPEGRMMGGNGLPTNSYLAEMRSQSGDSGSPVFLVIEGGNDRGNGTMMPFHCTSTALLGILTGHVAFTERKASGFLMAVNTQSRPTRRWPWFARGSKFASSSILKDCKRLATQKSPVHCVQHETGLLPLNDDG
jgi:hypothetical protein